MASLTQIKQQVGELTTVVDSVGALMTGLKAQLDEAVKNNDMAMVRSISDELGSNIEELKRLTVQNTEAENEGTEETEE